MASDETPSVEKQPLQFSILSLLVLTTVVAIGLSVIVVVVQWIDMNSLEAAAILLRAMLFRLPAFGVWLVAAVIAWRRRGRHPGVSKLVLAAALGYVLVSIVQVLSEFWFHHLIRTNQIDFVQVYWIVQASFGSLGYAICLALLVIAVFAWRKPAE